MDSHYLITNLKLPLIIFYSTIIKNIIALKDLEYLIKQDVLTN